MILVTGANGFIGKSVQDVLKKRELDFIVFEGDLTDIATYPDDKLDYIIHLAALVTHTKEWKSEELAEVNVGGTSHLLDKYPNVKMVYVSTTDVEKNLLTPYAQTKQQAEHLVLKHGQHAVIRIPSVFGPQQTQDKLIPRLIKHYFQNKPCVVENDSVREYVFVYDVANFIIDHMDGVGIQRMSGIKINNYRVREMVEAICNHGDMTFSSPGEAMFFKQLEECCNVYHHV